MLHRRDQGLQSPSSTRYSDCQIGDLLHADQIIRALFYLLQENPTNAGCRNYSEYRAKDYKFSYPSTVDQEFLKNIPPMLDGLIGSAG
ncbi:MAG: hypothetical protein ACLTKQ_07120 [Acutalibacteraceae bacterium]